MEPINNEAMKLKTIYLLFLCCIILCACTACSGRKTITETRQTEVQASVSEEDITIQKAIHEIKDFYVAYTTNFLSDNSSNDSLMEKYLTQRLIAKVDRMSAATDSDPIIRAQDFREDLIETLSVNHLDKNWYMVGYTWVFAGTANYTNIPVRVNKTEGRYMIDYITPAWNGSLYGDRLLFDNPVQQPIDTSSPLSFLKTFYAAYTMEYCGMSEELIPQLAALRAKYLTPNALAQFEAKANEYKLDGEMGYDLLIDYFDFDRLWLSSMTYTQLDKDTYQVCYTRWEPLTIVLKVTKQGKEYRIDSIKTKY
ncbi:hypothetical protein EZS27_016150 [termite gut metagenome]|uniref:DUF3828 domain-containing protein n=1 Tax=termite gut metagenome TaxID=433724 RepID=A0A5J4RPQ0_9ZZZZ